VAVLAAFADQGVKSEEAGTQFAIVLRDLQTRALENADAFERAGIAVFDSRGEFRNFADVIGDIERRLAGMSDAQRKAELATLGFTDKSIAALTVLLGTSDAIREYETNVREMGGITQEVADKQLESFQGKLDLLKGRVTDLQIALGEGLVPALITVADSALVVAEPLADLIGLLNDLGQSSDDVESSGAFQGNLFTRLFRSLPGGVLFDLKDGWDALWESMLDGEDIVEGTTNANQELADRLIALEPAVMGATAAIGEMSTVVELTERQVEALAFAEKRQATASLAARDAVRAKRDALREIHNPLFAVVSLNNDLADAEEAVKEASKKGVASPEYRDAVIDRARVIADLQSTMADLKTQGIDPTGQAARLMFEGLGIPPNVIAEIFAQYDALEADWENRVLNTTFSLPDFHARSDGTWSRSGSSIIRSQHGGIFEPRPGGSFTNIAEAGSREAVIPLNGEGIRILSSAMQQAGGGASAGTTYNIFTLTWGDYLQKANKAGIDIQRLGW
jgi:hypothetical protein